MTPRKKFSEHTLGVRMTVWAMMFGMGWLVFLILLGLWKLTTWLVAS